MQRLSLAIVAKRTHSEVTAEAKYYLALIEYKLGNYKDSQKVIFEIAKVEPGYDFWIAKGFILLRRQLPGAEGYLPGKGKRIRALSPITRKILPIRKTCVTRRRKSWRR
jgi:hypothetical protein